MPKIISFKQLDNAGACPPQLEQFMRSFGHKVDLSDPNETLSLIDAFAGHFDIDWAARVLLPRQMWYKQYIEETKQLYIDYKENDYALYNKMMDTPQMLDEDREKAEQKRDELKAQYRRNVAKVFIRLYVTQE
jgi:hypothetical protein